MLMYVIVLSFRDGKERVVADAPPRVIWLSRALRERRLSLGNKATQQEIARRAHVSQRQLQKIEQGSVIPRVDTLLALADALRTDLQTLLDQADELRRRSLKPRSSRSGRDAEPPGTRR